LYIVLLCATLVPRLGCAIIGWWFSTLTHGVPPLFSNVLHDQVSNLAES